MQTFAAVWTGCGFTEAPDYQTVRLRFIELGDYWESIGRGADQLIQHAKRWEPGIGQFVHVDACAFETQARLEHCCPRGVRCNSQLRWWKRAAADEVKDKRHEAAEEREPEGDELPASVVPRVPPRTRVDDATVPAHLRPPAGLDERYAYCVIDGCLRRSFDPTVGLRIFHNPDGTVKKSWLGGIGQAANDALTGASRGAGLRREHDGAPPLQAGASHPSPRRYRRPAPKCPSSSPDRRAAHEGDPLLGGSRRFALAGADRGDESCSQRSRKLRDVESPAPQPRSSDPYRS